MPPAWMWPLPRELEHHFELVEERRASGRSKDDEDEDTGMMMKNEYAKGRGREAPARDH